MLVVDRQLKPTNDKHTKAGVRETETETPTKLGDFLASLATFLSDFISKKRLATNLATYSDHQGKGEKYIIL